MLRGSSVEKALPFHYCTIFVFVKEWIPAWYMNPLAALGFFTLSVVCVNTPRHQLHSHPHCRRLALALPLSQGVLPRKHAPYAKDMPWLYTTPNLSRPAINSVQSFIHKHICCSIFTMFEGPKKAHCPLSAGVECIHLSKQLCFPKKQWNWIQQRISAWWI